MNPFNHFFNTLSDWKRADADQSELQCLQARVARPVLVGQGELQKQNPKSECAGGQFDRGWVCRRYLKTKPSHRAQSGMN